MPAENRQFVGCLTVDKAGCITCRKITFLPDDSEPAVAIFQHALELFEITADLHSLITFEQLRAKLAMEGLNYRSFEPPQKMPRPDRIVQFTRLGWRKYTTEAVDAKIMRNLEEALTGL